MTARAGDMPKAPAPALGKGGGRGLGYKQVKLGEPVPAWRTQAAYRLGVPDGSG